MNKNNNKEPPKNNKPHNDKNEKEEDNNKDEAQEDKNSVKRLLIATGIIVAVFALFFLARRVYNPQKEALTIDELHQKNIQGEETENNYIYNGFSFVHLDLWYTQVKNNKGQLVDIPLHYGPRQLENISISGTINQDFQKPIVYITIDPDDRGMNYIALASSELSLNLAKGIGLVPKFACSKNETKACKDRPILNCSNSDKAMIYLQQSNTTGSIDLGGNCIKLKGNNWELVKAVDRLLLQWYQIME